MLNALAPNLPGLIGGSADLAPSNMTLMKMFGDFQKASPAERNLRFGVREHAMGAICNGIALHSPGFVPYCATFFIFTDYMRNPMRMSALSEVGAGLAPGACAVGGRRGRAARQGEEGCCRSPGAAGAARTASFPLLVRGTAPRRLRCLLTLARRPLAAPGGRDLRDDPRLHRPGRGRPHPPARGAPGLLPHHAQHAHHAPRRRQRDRRLLLRRSAQRAGAGAAAGRRLPVRPLLPALAPCAAMPSTGCRRGG